MAVRDKPSGLGGGTGAGLGAKAVSWSLTTGPLTDRKWKSE